MTDTLRPRANPNGNPPASEQARLIDDRIHQMGTTWYALGQAIGVSPSYMSHIKAGRYTISKPDMIQKVARLLHIETDDLYITGGTVPPDVITAILDHPQLVTAVRKAREKMAS